MTESLENMKCQLDIDNDTEVEIQNYFSKNVENDFVIVKKGDKEFPIRNMVYSNARIIVNTNVAQFKGKIRLKGWSTGLRRAYQTSGLRKKRSFAFPFTFSFLEKRYFSFTFLKNAGNEKRHFVFRFQTKKFLACNFSTLFLKTSHKTTTKNP